MSRYETESSADVAVYRRDLYNEFSEPVPGGPLDRRMGVGRKGAICATCGLGLDDCPGHWGFVRLPLPCFHPLYFKVIIEVLNQVCKACHRLLLPPLARQQFIRRFSEPGIDFEARGKLRKAVLDLCKKQHVCPYCDAPNGLVKKVGILRLIHELGPEVQSDFKLVAQRDKEIAAHIAKASKQTLTPITVLEIFQGMIDEDIRLLDMDPELSRPEDMILQSFAVPPCCIRPSVAMDSGGPGSTSNEDDLTGKVNSICSLKALLEANIARGASAAIIAEAWENLHLHLWQYVTGDAVLPAAPSAGSGRNQTVGLDKPIRGILTRLKGKSGRFRGNLSGKRVDFSGRTVISPDPNIGVDEVVVPVEIAKILTFPERVTTANIRTLRTLVLNGPDKHPGAQYVVDGKTGDKTYLRFSNRRDVARQLRVGDIVERHLHDGDAVLFNRQPSLHKLSIMCHRARVMANRTFRFNVCCCSPYNADFDGDEMNIHLPQTLEARSEAFSLMGVIENLVSPKDGAGIIAATQDFLTGSYLLTRKNTFLDRAGASQLVAEMLDADRPAELPPPAICFPVQLWTGKQIFSCLMRSSSTDRIKVNVETKGKVYGGSGKWMDPMDGYILIRNSELLSGAVCKNLLGGSKSGIPYFIIRNYSPREAGARLLRIAKLSTRFLMNRGYSIGVQDVTPDAELQERKSDIVMQGYDSCDKIIWRYQHDQFEAAPGCTAAQTVEAQINGDLSRLRESTAQICLSNLHFDNLPLVCALCGSKGSNINISQMVACVGQQTVSGSRPGGGLVDRALPFFPHHAIDPPSRGFVANSFYSGLTPPEFVFHAMAGREGLVDTAVKTADTGYMQHRLVKSMEDVAVMYDWTVRNATGHIIQFVYGDDGLDPAKMETDTLPVDFSRLLAHVRAQIPDTESPALLPYEVVPVFNEYLNTLFFTHGPSDPERHSVLQFAQSLAQRLANLRASLNLPPCLEGPHARPPSNPERVRLGELAYRQIDGVTRLQLQNVCRVVRRKFAAARADPGHAVGPIAGQSIGEPSTQMTLRTFHFAGVASMSVTQGVPRIKEIINAVANIASPIVTCALNSTDITAARVVKGRLEKTTLGEISAYIREVYTRGSAFIEVCLDMERIHTLQLDIDVYSVVNSLCAKPGVQVPAVSKLMASGNGLFVLSGVDKSRDSTTMAWTRLPLTSRDVQVTDPKAAIIHIYPPSVGTGTMDVVSLLQTLKKAIPDVIVAGLPTVRHAVINQNDNTYQLLLEGTGLRQIFGVPGINPNKTVTNSVIETAEVLGIEAARSTIMSEIGNTMGNYGIAVDIRHITLLAEIMTYRGRVLGITRHGIARMRASTLMLASFEKTGEHLTNAAVHASLDSVQGVSENVIVGAPVPIGTGSFQLLCQPKPFTPQPRRVSILSQISQARANPDYQYDLTFMAKAYQAVKSARQTKKRRRFRNIKGQFRS